MKGENVKQTDQWNEQAQRKCKTLKGERSDMMGKRASGATAGDSKGFYATASPQTLEFQTCLHGLRSIQQIHFCLV